MPSKEQLRSVGESCSEFERVAEQEDRSCETCAHWKGEESMCRLDIFLEQLQSLDQE